MSGSTRLILHDFIARRALALASCSIAASNGSRGRAEATKAQRTRTKSHSCERSCPTAPSTRTSSMRMGCIHCVRYSRSACLMRSALSMVQPVTPRGSLFSAMGSSCSQTSILRAISKASASTGLQRRFWRWLRAIAASRSDGNASQDGACCSDPQFYMHVDTFHPTWKVFVFAAGTQLENGPFHFVNGSHGAHTIGKLRWLYDRSRMHVHVDFVNHGTGSIYSMAEAASAATSAPPAQRTTTKGATAVLREGPYDDATHTVGRTASGAIRFVGFDPKQGPAGGASVAASLSSYGLPLPTPVLVAPGGSPTLVIVDTSCFHFRGYARPGAKREAARLDGRGGGCSGCIPRKNVYACMGSGIDTVSESTSETGSTGIC